MTQGALPFVHLLAAKKGFAIAAFLQIDGEDDGGRAGRLSTLDDGPANFPYICRIELLPNWPACVAAQLCPSSCSRIICKEQETRNLRKKRLANRSHPRNSLLLKRNPNMNRPVPSL